MLTERSREDIIEEMLTLRKTCYDYSIKIDDLKKINLQLSTELAQSKNLLKTISLKAYYELID